MNLNYLTQYHNFPLLQMKKLRLREFRNLVKGHKASRWQTWDLNVGCQLVRLHCWLPPKPPEERGLRFCWVPKCWRMWIMNQLTECF